MRYGIMVVTCWLTCGGAAWVAADENGNRRQPASETRSTFYQRLVERFDRDGDGRLDDQERQAARRALPQNREPEANRSGSARSRNNGNQPAGSATRSRSARGASNRSRSTADERSELLKRFDVNRNGKLDDPELARLRQSRSRSRENSANRGQERSGNSRMSRDELLQRFDKNRNGRIDGDEMKQVRAAVGRRDRDSARVPGGTRQVRLDQAELLKRFDLNQDQRLDATERQQALEAMRNKAADQRETSR